MADGLAKIIQPRGKDLGDGFKVRRVLPFHTHKMVGPFIFFDHFGPVDYAPGTGFDVRPHPHVGLSTVTYLFEGAIRHKDTLGTDLVIRPGAVNWMTAGRGIAHSERTPEAERASGQSMHGIQTWVALPKEHVEAEPAFVHHPADTLPDIKLGAADAKVIAGTAFGAASPVEFPWPIWYVGAQTEADTSFEIAGDEAIERAIYIADGEGRVGETAIAAGEMAVLEEGADVTVTVAAGTRFMLAGGAPMDGPRKIDWNFVAVDTDRIAKAKADWRASIAGNWQDTPFGMPPGENEFIPLPEDA